MYIIYRKNTPTTKNVINIPVELKAIAPMAQPDSNRKYCSGMSWQFSFVRSGIVPFWHVMHCVSSYGWRICKWNNKTWAHGMAHHLIHRSLRHISSILVCVFVFFWFLFCAWIVNLWSWLKFKQMKNVQMQEFFRAHTRTRTHARTRHLFAPWYSIMKSTQHD